MSRRARVEWRRAQLGSVVVGIVGVVLVGVAILAGRVTPGPNGAGGLFGSGSDSSVSTTGPQLAGGWIRIPRFHVMAAVDAVSSPDGVLGVPTNPARLGWWTGSAMPGGGQGGVVVDGHVNYRGTSGALAVVPKLRPGDRVSVELPHGGRTVDYSVSYVRSYTKHGGLPEQIFDQDGPERLVLITCGGTYDSSSGNYESNVIAYAYPTRNA